MNHSRRLILWGALASVVAALLFPPFHYVGGAGYTIGLGFGFLLSWPQYQGMHGTIDVAMLLAEWLAIAIAAGILWKLKSGNHTHPADIQAVRALIEKANTDPRNLAAIRAALDRVKGE